MTYNQTLNHLEKQRDHDIRRELHGERFWTFKGVLDHRKVEGKWLVLVKWEDNTQTWEPLGVIGKDDPVTVAKYARENDLLLTPGWKQFRRYAKTEKKINRLMKQLHMSASRHQYGVKVYKFGVEIPRDFKDAERLDRENGNTMWKDARALEIKQLFDYETFESKGKGAPIPDGYERIKVKIIYDCKHDYRRKARCVARGDLTSIQFTFVASKDKHAQ